MWPDALQSDEEEASAEGFMTAQPSIESFFNDFEDALSDIAEPPEGQEAPPPTDAPDAPDAPDAFNLRHWASLETLQRKRSHFMTSQRSRSASDFYADSAGSRKPEAKLKLSSKSVHFFKNCY